VTIQASSRNYQKGKDGGKTKFLINHAAMQALVSWRVHVAGKEPVLKRRKAIEQTASWQANNEPV